MPRSAARRAAFSPRLAGKPASSLCAALTSVTRRLEPLPAQSRLQRERQLDAAGPAAHDDDARFARQLVRSRHQIVDPAHEARDRPRRYRVLAHPGQIQADDRRADVERREVVAQGRPAVEQHLPRVGVDPCRRRHDHLGAGPASERHDVDLELVPLVLAGHEARHHARVDRDRRVDDQGDAQILRRLHDEAPEHLDMRVTTADEDEMAPAIGRRL